MSSTDPLDHRPSSAPSHPLSFPTTVFARPGALARFFVTAAAGVGLDLWTKKVAFATLANGATDPAHFIPMRVIEVIPGWLRFEATLNHGEVFGLGQGMRTLFLTVSCAAILFLIYLFANSAGQRFSRFYQFVLGLLLAGVLGNMYDRIFIGAVRDMIKVLSRWPDLFPYIFNVADIMLCTGVGLLIFLSLFPPRTQVISGNEDEAGGSNV